FHYMVAAAGGADIPCVPYATFGSEALSDVVAAGLKDRDACLMANHGQTSCGTTMAGAMKVMVEVEALCRTYLLARAVGEPPVLPAAEMKLVLKRFKGYGRRRVRGAGRAA
ncbi:MAG TPA: class II aldolase/adducin family protein, partial [Burkholderiaceae bacterium]|nr:class II aldolase/adducin family protein [Burkholderiaceae bacterium]